jgi:hypothetical protein
MIEACSMHGGDQKCESCKILVGNSVWKRPLGRHVRRWEDNIKMGLKEVGWEGVDWIYLA